LKHSFTQVQNWSTPLKFSLLIFSVFLVFACNTPETHKSSRPLEINPIFNKQNANADFEKKIESVKHTENKPKITIDSNQTLIKVIDTNLDLDTHEEQILIVKNNTSVDSKIRVLVADFDNIIDSYSISWEAETASNNITSFSISLKDVTGDHNLELICSGSDMEGKETLNIYRRTPADGGIKLHFSEILNLTADGSIEIKENHRSQAYQTGISDGISFQVIVTSTDTDSDNILDLKQETYFWQNQESIYKLISVDKLPGKEIADSKLRTLYRSNREYFKNFLAGPWMLANSDNNLSYNNSIVYFDTENEQIIFSNIDFQEIYVWESSSKTLSNTLLIACKNDLVPFLDVSLSVRVLDINNINLRFKDNSTRNSRNTTNQAWTGTYFKLSPKIQRDLIRDYRSTPGDSTIPILSGYYKSDTGAEIFFNTSNFKLMEKGEQITGGFYLVNNGLKIAEFKILDKNKILKKTLVYKYDFFKESNDIEIIRTLILIPGELTIQGFVPSGEQFTRYTQIEQIEKDDSNTNFNK